MAVQARRAEWPTPAPNFYVSMFLCCLLSMIWKFEGADRKILFRVGKIETLFPIQSDGNIQDYRVVGVGQTIKQTNFTPMDSIYDPQNLKGW